MPNINAHQALKEVAQTTIVKRVVRRTGSPRRVQRRWVRCLWPALAACHSSGSGTERRIRKPAAPEECPPKNIARIVMRIEISRQVNCGAGQQHADIDAGLQHRRNPRPPALGPCFRSKRSRRPIRRQCREQRQTGKSAVAAGLRQTGKPREHGVSENRQARARLRPNTSPGARKTAAERPTNQKAA